VFRHVLTYYVLLFGGLSIAVMLVARPLVMVLTQPAFHQAYLVLGFSALAQCLYGMFYVLLPGAYFAKDVRFVTIMQALAATIAVAANVILIRWFGLAGAGLGLVVGAAAQAGLQHLRNAAVGHLPVRYEWGRIAGVGAAFVAYGFVALWPRRLSLGAEIAIASAAAASLIPLLLLMLRPEERRWLWRLAGRVLPRRGNAPA
jgi:O-antigen/teichoic acid export membrane protein